MALSAGTVTVDGDLTHSGSGMALTIYEAFKARAEASSYWDDLSSTQKLNVLSGNAEFAGDLATGIVASIKADADVVITTSQGGLQSVGGSATDPPLSQATISGAIN